MKKIGLLVICAVVTFVANAQTNNDELKFLQDRFGIEKKLLVKEQMNISKADSAKFWALYDEYELFRTEISDKRGENIQLLAKNYNTTDAQLINEMMQNTFNVNLEINKLWQKTYKTMAKELNPTLAAKFIYHEMYYEVLGKKWLVEHIPDIKKLEQGTR